MGFYIPILSIIILFILYKIIRYFIVQYLLGTLTGKYIHYKTVKGVKMKVQHKIDGELYFRPCTEEDYKLLQKLKYIK